MSAINNRFLLSTVLLGACAAPALAQSTPGQGSSTVLAPIVVQTPLDEPVRTTTRAAPAPAAGKPSQAATGQTPADAETAPSVSAPSAADALAGASAIGREDLQLRYQPESMADVLRSLPGVAIQQTARDPGFAVNVRGLQDFGRVNVLIDGMRQNFQRSGHSANGVVYLDPEMVKAVDITRGPTSTIYGSGAIGGVVAFELLDPEDILRSGESVALQSRLRYQTNGAGPLGSLTGATRIGNFAMLGQVSGKDIGDYTTGNGTSILNSKEEMGSALGRLRWAADGHQIYGTALYYNSRFVDSAVAAGSNPRDSELENKQLNIAYRFLRPDTPLLDVALKLYRNETDLTQRKLTGVNAGTYRGFNLVTEGFDASNTSRFSWANAKLALTVGSDGFRDRVATYDQDPLGNADDLTPGGERSVFGAFTQAQLTVWSVFDIIGAVRYDEYALDGGTTHIDGSRVSPKLTLGWRALPGMTIYGTYAEGYRAPAITETLITGQHPPPAPFVLLPNPNLRPEIAQNLEGGINFKYQGVLAAKDVFRAKFGAFSKQVEDFIEAVYTPVPAPGVFQYQNLRNVKLEGVEFEAAYDSHLWFASIAASRVRGTNLSDGQPVASVSPDHVALTLGMRIFENRMTLGSRARFVAEQKRVPTGAPTSEAYTLLDLFAAYKASDSVSLNLNVDNVFDKQYIAYRDQSASPGLNARLGITVRLGAP